MQEIIQSRLATLRAEYGNGQERLRELRQQEAALHETLMRIEGAMTVLQEFLQPAAGDTASPVSAAAPAPEPAPADSETA